MFMRMPSSAVVRPEASQYGFLQAAQEIPGTMIRIKIAGFLLRREGQHLGWVDEMLGLTP